MMFACLTAPADGGATAVADAPAVLERAARATWSTGSSARAGCSPATTTTRSGRPYAEAFGTDDRGAVEQLLPGQRDRVRVAARRRTAHPAAPQRRGAAPGHRAALLVQPDRVPQRVDAGPGGARVPGGRLRRRRAAVQHPLRQRRPDRRGRRAAAQQRLRGPHRAASRGRPATCCWSTTSAPRTAGSPTRARARCSSGWPSRCNVADCAPTAGMTATSDCSRRRAAPPFAVISGAQVQQALQGQREADRRAGRGHLPAARRRRLGEPAVVLPALPGPADRRGSSRCPPRSAGRSGWTA